MMISKMLEKEKVINKVWIDKEFKKIYFNESENGLRINFSEYIVQELKEKIIDFIKFLRRRYYFPIRCTIFIEPNNGFFEKENSTKKTIGDFYYYEDHIKNNPFIWIATGKYHYVPINKKDTEMKNILFTITHELTHYYQWFFMEIDKRTDRSLEIEANRWANYLLEEYFEETRDKVV